MSWNLYCRVARNVIGRDLRRVDLYDVLEDVGRAGAMFGGARLWLWMDQMKAPVLGGLLHRSRIPQAQCSPVCQRMRATSDSYHEGGTWIGEDVLRGLA